LLLVMMKRLIVDIGRLERRLGRNTPTGVDRVILAYALYLISMAGDQVTFTRSVFGIPIPYDRSRAIEILSLSEKNWTEGSRKTLGRFKTLAARCVEFAFAPFRMRKIIANPFVYFTLDHNGLEPNGVVDRLSAFAQSEIVVFLHDLIPISHPEYSVAHIENKHHQRMAQIAKSASLVIANSHFTEQQLVDYLAGQNQSVPRIVTAHLGIEQQWNLPTQDQSSRNYFVVLGTIEGRKNHLTLLNVWRRLSLELGDKTPILHVVGRRGWEAEAVFDLLDRCPALKSTVVEHTDMSDSALLELVSGARALLFPSHVEGYGLPLAEALSSGVPVIAADIPVFREIAGDIPEYRDPLDALGWQDAVLEYAKPASERRAAQLLRLKTYKPYYWKDHFQVVWPHIETVAQGGSDSTRPR
jgi:glycosyltransferase involved in cell wall biosynthesis